MAAARLRLLGDENSLSSAPKRRYACAKILDLMWDSDKAEYFFDQLTAVLTDARNVVRPNGESEFDGALVNSKIFAEQVRRIALGTN